MKLEIVRKLREEKKLSQEDIATLLNTTKQQYYRYETGRREIPLHHLITLADYFEVSLDILVGRK